MPYDIRHKLVIAIASSALFNLSESDTVFRESGEFEYRAFQRAHEHEALQPGVAFPFIKRLLQINMLFPEEKPVEVILLSRNDPDTGQRVFNSIQEYSLDISRGGFLSGKPPFRYLPAFNASLFLSANGQDVIDAIQAGYPAGRVLKSSEQQEQEEAEDFGLRIAFDFDGIIVDDTSESVYQQKDLAEFQRFERSKAHIPHDPGPLRDFFFRISEIQKLERNCLHRDPSYKQYIRTAIITARNAPSNERVVTTLRDWDIMTDETFFLGGIDKSGILDIFKPHIYFDDQLTHLTSAHNPSVHVPFGAINSGS